MFKITQCPICNGKNLNPYLSCIDYTVSHETFELIKCNSCDLVITSPRPENVELAKYYISDDYISHSNRSATLIEKTYQIARNFSLDWKLKLVEKYSGTEKTLLDYGCGTGEFINHVKQNGYRIQGVEPSQIARIQAEHLTKQKIAESIQQVDNEVESITLWHVLEHVPDLNEIIIQLKARLQKNGTLFIAVPNHRSKDGQRYQHFWAGYDVPRHLWHFSQESMKKLFKKHELILTETVPMKLDSFYVSTLSEKYKHQGNTFVGLASAFINGMRSNVAASTNGEYSSLIYVAKK